MKGFTLIELLVSVGIGLTVTGMVVANYNSYNTTQALKQTALTMKNDIRFVQTKASSGVKPSDVCTASTPLDGWKITFSASEYTYGAICAGVSSSETTTITLPKSVTITTLPSPNQVLFSVLSRGTNLPADAPIILTSSGKNYEILLGKNGNISDLGVVQ